MKIQAAIQVELSRRESAVTSLQSVGLRLYSILMVVTNNIELIYIIFPK